MINGIALSLKLYVGTYLVISEVALHGVNTLKLEFLSETGDIVFSLSRSNILEINLKQLVVKP